MDIESSLEKGNIFHGETHIFSTSPSIPSNETKTDLPLPSTDLIEFQKALIGPAIGFSSYALCSFLLGLVNTKILQLPYSVVGVGFIYGVMGQVAAGIIEIFSRDVFNAVSFFVFAGFYFTYMLLFLPYFGVSSTLEATGDLDYAVGLLCTAYALPAFIFFVSTFRQPVIVRYIMAATTLANLLSALGGFTGIVYFTMTSGWISFSGSLVAWYGVLSLICNENTTFIKVPFI